MHTENMPADAQVKVPQLKLQLQKAPQQLFQPCGAFSHFIRFVQIRILSPIRARHGVSARRPKV